MSDLVATTNCWFSKAGAHLYLAVRKPVVEISDLSETITMYMHAHGGLPYDATTEIEDCELHCRKCTSVSIVVPGRILICCPTCNMFIS